LGIWLVVASVKPAIFKNSLSEQVEEQKQENSTRGLPGKPEKPLPLKR